MPQADLNHQRVRDSAMEASLIGTGWSSDGVDTVISVALVTMAGIGYGDE